MSEGGSAFLKRAKDDFHRILITVATTCALVASTGCRTNEPDTRSQVSGIAAPGADLIAIASRAADTEVIRGRGVPTAPDDTIGTRYGKHWGPARIIPPPDCLPGGFALCIADTARTAVTYHDLADGGMPDERVTEWLIFAAERDSMQIFIAGQRYSYLWMSPASATGFVAEHAINDASWIRARFARGGTYVYSVRIDSDSIVSYELRVVPVVATGASWPIGKSATLTIDADSSSRVAIAPAALTRTIKSDSDWHRYAVAPGVYRTLLVRDTLYVACRIPCRRPQRFTMRPGQSVAVRR